MDDGDGDDEKRLLPFPQSRVPMRTSRKPVRNLGLTRLSQAVGDASGRRAKGHWCSRCKGIWYSFFLESECPQCGNRHG